MLFAFHNDPKVKAKFLKRVKAHEKADEIIHGKYWENGKGCAVGCIIHGDDHAELAREIFGDESRAWLARLLDGIFEGQNNGDSKTFPRRFLSAIPVGANTELVKLPFLAWLMDDPKWGLANQKGVDSEIKLLALEVATKLRAGETTGEAADDLTKRLRDARAAWAARDAWAAWAAWDARDARAAWDAWDARDAWDAWAAWDAWDARDARAAFSKASADELIRLLSELPSEKRAVVTD